MCVSWFFYHTHTRTLQREQKSSSLCIVYLQGLKSNKNWAHSLIKTFKRFSLKNNSILNSKAPILWFSLLKTMQIIGITKFLRSAIFHTPHTWYLPTRTHTAHSLQKCLAHPLRTLCANPHSLWVCCALRTNTLLSLKKQRKYHTCKWLNKDKRSCAWI